MKFLLDTNACIRYLNDPASGAGARLKATPRENVALCSVVKGELYFGARKSARKEENLALLDKFFSNFDSLPFDDRAASVYGEVREKLSKQGKPIGPYDLQIAAIAKANDLTLITHNVSEFGRVERLQLEDWEAGGQTPQSMV